MRCDSKASTKLLGCNCQLISQCSGLVNAVYSTKEEMLAAAREMAQRINANSPLVVQGAKKVMNFADEHSTRDSLEVSFLVVFTTNSHKATFLLFYFVST